jgi:glutamine cyclotransferase
MPRFVSKLASAVSLPLIAAILFVVSAASQQPTAQPTERLHLIYESTGRQRQSTLRRVVLETGKVVQSARLPDESFGEGLTIFRGKIYQLTWLEKRIWIYL